MTFSARVTAVAPGAGTPTGTVQFMVDGSLYGSPAALSSGSASITDSALAVSSHHIAASYSGDGNFNSAASTTVAEQVEYGVCPLIPQNPPFATKSGATFPIKFYLCDAAGKDVSNSSVVVHATYVALAASNIGAVQDAGNANPDSDFRFDSTLGPSGGYIFNLKTTGLVPGTWLLYFEAGYNVTTQTPTDPVQHTLQFGVQ